jgi:Domain of unknown function (DUF4396)
MGIVRRMVTASHAHHDHDEGLSRMAYTATLHCLTGCALGEVVGMIASTALGLSNAANVIISIVLAFVFGYTLTSLPLLRAGMALATVAPIALATDTVSISVMEVIDNAIMVAVPGAINAGLGDVLFWGSLSFGLVVAGIGAFPVNRYLLARGKGHAVMHETGIHGGPDPRLVAGVAAVAGLFGTVVLLTAALG